MGEILIYILVSVYACLEGVCHGILYSRMAATAFKWNEHVVFVVQRSVIVLVALTCVIVNTTIIGTIISLFSAALAYSFFHNGFYYVSRKMIDGSYPDGFVSNSTSSTAKIELSWSARLVLFLISILVVIVNFYL